MAKFSRSSTAYKQDGSVVAAGVPRFESNGVMVEEGTVNLIPATAQDFVTGWAINTGTVVAPNQQDNYGGNNAYRITTISETGWTKHSLILSTTTLLNTNYCAGLWIKNNSINNMVVNMNGGTATGITVKQSQGWVYAKPTLVGDGATKIRLNFVATAIPNHLDITVYQPQVEQKPYATSFHPTTRAAESLTIPASCLNPSEGSIEFDCVMSVVKSCKLFYVRGSNSKDLSIGTTSGGGVTVQHFQTETTISSYLATNAKYRIGFKYDANSISLFINGVITYKRAVTGVHTSFLYAFLGSSSASGYQANALFSNLRISNKARSDAELANTGALSVDEFTTYFLPLNGNLSATCRPVMLVQGQGQVLLSRVGRGTRSIKVQGEGQVKLKRSAHYYPTISVGAKGEVKLSRKGIGYRKMKVEGQGSFKIQEPNIEIYPEIREREAKTNIIERESTTEVIGVPYAGDTIKIKGSFKSFEGVAADPTGITLKIYDTINNLLTTINVTSANRVSAGIYEVNYTIPEGYQALYYEWHCTQGDSPQVTMGKITILKRGQA